MLIYRVEKENGQGLYRDNDYPFSYEMVDSMRHPLPSDDALLSIFWNALSYESMAKFHFGYSSIEQLKSWVYRTSWREEIDKAGFRVNVYETENYKTGDTQAVFVKSKSKFVNSLSLLDI